MRYELYYWPGIQGRGEFIRLALEEANAAYIDVARLPARGGMGMPALMRLLDGSTMEHPPFAPPILKDDTLLIAQTANILQYLGPRLGLVPRSATARIWAHQLQLTISDLVNEVHDTHHPIATTLYYEDQQAAAKQRARDFRKNRLPKFLAYFENALLQNSRGARYMIGARLSYVDLSMFQMIAGLRYAFPKSMARVASQYPALISLHDRISVRPRIAEYCASKRRVPFNQEGIFRHYPALDQ